VFVGAENEPSTHTAGITAASEEMQTSFNFIQIVSVQKIDVGASGMKECG
jgi:hypothetical protein